MPHQYLVAMK